MTLEIVELVNHVFIKNAAMVAKKKAPAVLNHYEVSETLPAYVILIIIRRLNF